VAAAAAAVREQCGPAIEAAGVFEDSVLAHLMRHGVFLGRAGESPVGGGRAATTLTDATTEERVPSASASVQRLVPHLEQQALVWIQSHALRVNDAEQSAIRRDCDKLAHRIGGNAAA
jgi:hypothetical protein